MKVGIANPFAYRPHVAHMAFLDRQLKRLGYATFHLSCGGDLNDCNSKINKTGIAHALECMKCRAGGIRSYLKVQPWRLDMPIDVSQENLEFGKALAYSTTATALQIEHIRETNAEDFCTMQQRLSRPAAVAYANARTWIVKNRLDCVFIFNGRFDLTRAVLEACKAESVRFVSVERSWFGAGIQLLPNENCLGLRNFRELCRLWAARPLSYEQACKASSLIQRRLKRSSMGEWRQYNLDTGARYEKNRIRFLFLPSSQHEWFGEPDRTSGWEHPVDGIEYLFARLGLPLSSLVVRGHPGWAMKIKNYGPNRADDFYRQWTKRVGAEYIESSVPIDTHALIRISDLILVNGSSASMEAAWRGKPLISFVPAAFTSSGISRNLFAPHSVDALSEADRASLRTPGSNLVDATLQSRLALRYIYCANFRIMQFVDTIRSTSPFSFEAGEPVELANLESLVMNGTLQEDDPAFADDDNEEGLVVNAILSGNLDSIREPQLGAVASTRVQRRFLYRPIDMFSK